MAGLDLKGLIGKLNPVCQRALEGAAGLCLSRTNYNVEIEHWLVEDSPVNGTSSKVFRPMSDS